jgi:hypothetical protein
MDSTAHQPFIAMSDDFASPAKLSSAAAAARRTRIALWSLGFLSASLLVAVIVLAAEYSKAKNDCKDSSSNSSSSSNNNLPPLASPVPEQFTATGVKVHTPDGLNVTMDWYYDSVYGRETMTYTTNSSGALIEFRKHYGSGVGEMHDPKRFNETCTPFPMSKNSINLFDNERAVAVDQAPDADGIMCRRYHALRPDGSTYYFSTHETLGYVCSVEFDAVEYRFTRNAIVPGVPEDKMRHRCPIDPLIPSTEPTLYATTQQQQEQQQQEGMMKVRPQWGWHPHFSFHPHFSWLNPSHWWQEAKCNLCRRGVTWVANYVEGSTIQRVCFETGPLAGACRMAGGRLVNDEASYACQLAHLC